MRFRGLAVVLGMGILAASARAQDAGTTRYKVELEHDAYPQKTARETLESVLKAIDAKQLDYLVAQLADPQFVDMRVKTAAGGFPEVVAETRARLADDAAAVTELRRFLKEGMWDEAEGTATVKLKDVKNRAVFLRKVKDRWYLENRQK